MMPPEAEGVPRSLRSNQHRAARPAFETLGNVDIQVVAEVGTDIFETGICNWRRGRSGSASWDGRRRSRRCKLRVRNNGDRDAVVTRLDLVIGQSERPECGSSCSFGSYCTGQRRLHGRGPFAGFWPSDNNGFVHGAKLLGREPLRARRVLRPRCGDERKLLLDGSQYRNGQPIFRLQRRPSPRSATSPLLIEAGPARSVVTILFKQKTSVSTQAQIHFKGNLPVPGGILNRPMVGIGTQRPGRPPRVKSLDGSANYRRNDDGDPQAARRCPPSL